MEEPTHFARSSMLLTGGDPQIVAVWIGKAKVGQSPWARLEALVNWISRGPDCLVGLLNVIDFENDFDAESTLLSHS
jgi:hypothetical protein